MEETTARHSYWPTSTSTSAPQLPHGGVKHSSYGLEMFKVTGLMFRQKM